MNEAALQALLERCSVGAKHLTEPGPSDEQLALMARAALRAPDHGGLMPFRFVVIRGDLRLRFADLLERAGSAAGKAPEATALDRERALRAPVSVALVARIEAGHPLAPAHEQWIAVGGALANFLNAAHALGFGAKMLSGAKVRWPEVAEAFCAPGETLVGWIGLGTPSRPPAPAPHKRQDVLQPWRPR